MRSMNGKSSVKELTNHFETETSVCSGDHSDGHGGSLGGRFMELVAQNTYSFSTGTSSSSLFIVRHWMKALSVIPTNPR